MSFRHLNAGLFLTAALAGTALAAEPMPQSERIKGRTYSEAVITEGGRTVWLAGQTALADMNGKDIKGDFEAQARTVFALIDEVLKRAGGDLSNVVTMTVFMTDPRNGPTFQKVRAEMFPSRNYPASAQITVSNLAVPGMQIEIQAVAVIGDKCSAANSCLPR